jgi:hypothetical protein
MAKNKQTAKAAPAVKTTTVVNEKVAKALEVIKELYPYVKVAYFNADGEYHFHKRKGFAAVTIQEEEETDQDIEIEEDPETDPIDTKDKLEF